jgi:hypothetical protein
VFYRLCYGTAVRRICYRAVKQTHGSFSFAFGFEIYAKLTDRKEQLTEAIKQTTRASTNYTGSFASTKHDCPFFSQCFVT